MKSKVAYLDRTRLGFQGGGRMSKITGMTKQTAECILETADLRGREAGAPQSDTVEGTHRVGTVHDTKRRDVAAGAAQSTQQGQPPDMHELVHHAVRRHKHLILNLYISTQRGTIRDDHLIAHLAIMPHMGVVHEISVVADERRGPGLRAAVNLHVLSEDVPVADAQITLDMGVECEILRRITQNGAGMNHILGPDLCPAGQRDVRQDTRAWTDTYRPLDDDVRTDIGAGIDFRQRMDQCGRMDGHRS